MKAQSVIVRPGDIFLVRFGYIEASEAASDDRLQALANEPTFAGLEANDEMKQFLYELGAVIYGSDVPAFERWRPSSTICPGGPEADDPMCSYTQRRPPPIHHCRVGCEHRYALFRKQCMRR